MKKVLILQHVWENSTGFVGEILRQHAIAYDLIHVETEPIPNPSAFDAVIAFGGSQHVYEEHKYPYFTQEKVMIRKVLEQDIPYLGICLGGQLLAEVLEQGAVRQHTMKEFGFYDIALTEDGKKDRLYAGLPGYQKVFHWHEDVFDLPAGATLLATNDYAKNQAFRYRNAYGLQYHIEIDPAMLDTWLYHPDLQPKSTDPQEIEAYKTIEHTRDQHFPLYREHTSIMFGNFLKICELI
ncbi:MAG TPA: type 1 glutamine amidotransferase [Ktedonosporobacter sp.]|jgi:GMP synthase-like glutamine amidotransferase|nr:type 1 glutamine amidotransferase [Ktedonosporobacter sp.]